jgi:DNA-binding NarL/FixJ family response regulator
MPITLAIIEDDQKTRENLVALIESQASLRCLGAYATGEDAIPGILRDQPEVVLVDINLPGMNGIVCVKQLKTSLPRLQVLMLTTYEESDSIFESLKAGASGYLLKKTIPTKLISAIEEVHGGGAPMSLQIARKVVEHFHLKKEVRSTSDFERLTPRENEILALLAKGLLYKEIGEQLGISLGTVRTHMEHIYEKLHVQSRTEAAIKFLGQQ